jgi:hypothetical protein
MTPWPFLTIEVTPTHTLVMAWPGAFTLLGLLAVLGVLSLIELGVGFWHRRERGDDAS